MHVYMCTLPGRSHLVLRQAAFRDVSPPVTREPYVSGSPTCHHTPPACSNMPQACNIRDACGPARQEGASEHRGRGRAGTSGGVEQNAKNVYRLHHQHEKCRPSSHPPLLLSFSRSLSLRSCCSRSSTSPLLFSYMCVLVVVIYGRMYLVVQLRAPLPCCCIISFYSAAVQWVW